MTTTRSERIGNLSSNEGYKKNRLGTVIKSREPQAASKAINTWDGH